MVAGPIGSTSQTPFAGGSNCAKENECNFGIEGRPAVSKPGDESSVRIASGFSVRVELCVLVGSAIWTNEFFPERNVGGEGQSKQDN